MKIIRKTSEILSFVLISLAFIILIIEKISGWEFFTAELGRYILFSVLFGCSAVFYLISAVIKIASKSEDKKILTFISRIITCIVLCALVFELNSDAKRRKYYVFTSPDGQYSVVAEEWSYLLGGRVEFFERVNPFFIEHKEYFSTDDGYRAISSGDYTVEWNDNIMTITLQNGNRIYKTIDVVL